MQKRSDSSAKPQNASYTEPEEYTEKEAKARFEAALKSAMNTPHKPLKEKPKVAKITKPKKKPGKPGAHSGKPKK